MHRSAFPLFFGKALPLAIILLIFLLPHSLTVSGQKLSNYYTTALLDSGMLYFVFPLDDFQEEDAKSRLIFDISYLSSRDSATVNFSYFYSSVNPAGSLTFQSGDKVTVCPVIKLFIDLENQQKWHHRYTTTIHMSDLASFFRTVLPPEIIITTNDDPLTYRIRKNHWQKQGKIISAILQMIEANS